MTTTQFYLQPVSLQQAQQIYEQHMTRDFPPAELKPFAMIRQGMQQGSYDFLALYRADDTLMGYAVLVAEPGQPAALLDYYAVLPQTRGGGVGAAGLQLLRQYYAAQKDSILIESEYPAEAPDPAAARRRIGFYQRHGFFLNDYEYYQPPMRAGQEKLPLFIMSTGAPLNRAQFERTRDELYARVYKYDAKG